MNCTTIDCENPTETYMCNQCVKELATVLDTIPDMIPVLHMIGRKEEQPFTVRTDRPGGAAGPSTPLNINAIALAQDLTTAHSKTAREYAQGEDAADWAAWITQRAERAKLMVYGEDEQTVTPDYIKYRMSKILPMPTRLLVPWLAENMGLHLTPERIKKWGQNGLIQRRNNGGGHPTYHPADVIRAHQESRIR